MANNLQISYAACNAEAAALAPLMNSGKLRIYGGTVPTRADDSIGAATLLAELTMNATAFTTGTNGVMTANSIAAVNAAATGTATFFRVWDSAGTTDYIQGTVGTAGCDMNIDSVAISAGAQVSITAFTYTVVRGA